MISIRAAVLFSLALITPALVLSQSRKDDRPNDNSDWWSIIRENSTDQTLKPQQKEVKESNFRILGVVVGRDDLQTIQEKLGAVIVIGRGDASTGRTQICYVGGNGRTHLIFDTGEVQSGIYLFAGGPQWSYSDRCAKSKWVTSNLRLDSGLRLGLSEGQVEAILGKPTSRRKNGDLIYFLQVRKKTADADLKKMREYYPNDPKFHENYDYYDQTVDIRAKFSASKLIYLGITKSDTY